MSKNITWWRSKEGLDTVKLALELIDEEVESVKDLFDVEKMIGLTIDDEETWDETICRLERLDHPALIVYKKLCERWEEIQIMNDSPL